MFLDLTSYLDESLIVTIYNHLGQQRLIQPFAENHDAVERIDLASGNLPSDIYLLSVRTAEGQAVKQFVIAR